MKLAKKIIVGILSVLVVVLLFIVLQRLVMPKYDGSGDMPLEGNFTEEYYNETTKHDVLMVGDCEVYENIDTMYLWKNFGITSYIRGNAQQLTWQSYYMLEDTLKYETPKVLIYNVQALEHATPQKETYNRMTLDGMKWSKTKWDAINTSMCDGENMLDYLFPILRYHSRITSLTKNDIKYYFTPKQVSHNGYYMRIDVLPVSESDVADTDWIFGISSEKEEEENEIDDPWADIDVSEDAVADDGEIDDPWADIDAGEDADSEDKGTDASDKTFGKLPMQYLDKMRKLCEKKGIKLLLMKAPSASPVWYEEEDQQIRDYAKKYGLDYINFYDLIDEIGLDYETDTYDGGLHLNLQGADKLSEYLGKYLVEQYQLPDHRKDNKIAGVYDKKLKFYEDMIKAQQAELDKYGEIRSY